MAVFLRYTNKQTGKAFFTVHENIEHPVAFLRKVAKISREIGRDSKCDVQEISEETYHAAKGKAAA